MMKALLLSLVGVGLCSCTATVTPGGDFRFGIDPVAAFRAASQIGASGRSPEIIIVEEK